MKWLWLTIALVLSGADPAQAFWEKTEFLIKRTQSLKVQYGNKTDQGVLLLKHYKFGRPIFLISTFTGKQVNKTKMLHKRSFFRLYNQLYTVVRESQPASREIACQSVVKITFKKTQQQASKHNFCLDKVAPKQKEDFSDWVQHIEQRL